MIRPPLNHYIAIVTSSSNVTHGVQGGARIALLPVDERGRTEVPTVCGKVVKGDIGNTVAPEHIRCRPCKRLIGKGRSIVPIRKG